MFVRAIVLTMATGAVLGSMAVGPADAMMQPPIRIGPIGIVRGPIGIKPIPGPIGIGPIRGPGPGFPRGIPPMIAPGANTQQ